MMLTSDNAGFRMKAKAPTPVDPFKLVSKFIDCGNVDTVCRDVYWQSRAR
jgi:hypothetical protein